MSDKAQFICLLIERYLGKGISDKELKMLDQWVAESAENRQVFELFSDPVQLRKELRSYFQAQQAPPKGKEVNNKHLLAPEPMQEGQLTAITSL